MKMHGRIPALLLALLLGACGFQLRGDAELPPRMERTYIHYSGGDAEIRRTVARALTLSGVTIAREPEAASAILLLPGAGVEARVVARDPAGRPREYELTARFRFSVVTADGERLVPEQEVAQFGNVVLDPTEPLANAGEVQRAVNALREEAVWEMLRQISANAGRLPRGDEESSEDDAATSTGEDGR